MENLRILLLMKPSEVATGTALEISLNECYENSNKAPFRKLIQRTLLFIASVTVIYHCNYYFLHARLPVSFKRAECKQGIKHHHITF
ncbi:hypothetical protein CVS40_3858 [Lucilia cuprina]|nr:hypothetical protein CVS40_3858 [Lucilia cuprina]